MSRNKKPNRPHVKTPGLMPVKKQTRVRPAQAKTTIEGRKMPGNIYRPGKPRTPQQGAILAAAAGFASGTVAGAPNIVELARALKNDVDLIYQFVHDHIEWLPTYGSQKGALGCLIDGYGNSFDQSELMIELLREAGYTASYQLGELELTEADAAAWFGTDVNIWAEVNYLSDGGIPCEEYWTGSEWKIRFNHCFVKVTISSTDYVFDPARKSYSTVTGINMATALSYSQSTFLSNATSGATIATDYVQDINRSNIRSDLDDFTANLVDYIKTNDPDATTDDILGGKTIDPTTGTLRNTSLSYLRPSTTPTTWSTDIPAAYCATLNVYYDTIDETFYSKDIHGKRLTLFFNGSHEAELRLDGTLIDTSSAQTPGSWNSVWLEVVHPYPTTFADEGHWQTVWADGKYLIAQAWGNAGFGFVNLATQKRKKETFAGGSSSSEPVFGENLSILWHTWNYEKSRVADLINRLSNCVTVLHHQTGLVGFVDSELTDLGGIVWASSALDNDWDNVDTNDTALAMHGISFETGAIEQSMETGGASTTPLIDIANTAGQKIYLADSSNWTSGVKPNLTNYDSGTLTDIENWWINAGWSVAIPEDGALSKDDWDGYAYYAISPWYGAIGIINGTKGGAGTKLSGGCTVLTGSCNINDYKNIDIPPLLPMTPSMDELNPTPGIPGGVQQANGPASTPPMGPPGTPTGGDPVDLFTGFFGQVENDISVGMAGMPYGLVFSRTYNSGRRLDRSSLGYGWDHNFNATIKEASDPYRCFAEENVTQAAALLVELFVTVDLYKDLSKPLDKWVVVALANHWLNDQLTDTAVRVNGLSVKGAFVKLPDGTYENPRDLLAELTKSGGTFTLADKDGIEYAFNSDGQLSTITYPAGPVVTLSYTSGKLSSVSNGMGRTLTLTYSGDNLASVSDGNGRTVTYTVDGAGKLTTVTNPESEDTAYEYDSDKRLKKIFYPAKPLVAFIENTYDDFDRVKEQKDGKSNLFKFFIAGNRTEVEDPVGNLDLFYWNRDGKVISRTDPSGNTSTNEYDGLGRRVKYTMPEGNSSEFTYDSDGNVTEIRRKAKSGSGLSDVVVTLTYDTVWKHKIKTATDPRGKVTTYNWNSTTGTLTSINRPTVNSQTPTISYTYNARGQILTSTDETGIVTECAYDTSTEKLLSMTVDKGTGLLNLETQFGYDSVGNITSVTDPRGNATAADYDDVRRIIERIAPSPLSYVTKYTYDANSNLTKIERETGDISTPWQTVETAFGDTDEAASVQNPAGDSTAFTYDANERLWKTTDPESRTVEYLYDSASRISSIKDPTGTTQVTKTYTDNGFLASIKDANNNTITLEYDGLDRVKKRTYPDSTYEEYTWDANNNMLTLTTRAGATITYTYDDLNRVATKTPQSEPTVSYEYDLSDRILVISTPTVSGDPTSGDFEYSYDTAGRLIQEEYPDGKTVSYELDENGNVTKITYPDGYYVERFYDELNRLTDIKLNGATSSALQFDYDNLSRRVQLTYDNGVTTTYDYQIDDDMSALEHTFSGSSVEFTYGFNTVHELTSQGVDDSQYMWHPAAGGTVSYGTANNRNQYPTVGGVSQTYDSNGCLTSDGTWTFGYDVQSHLISASKTGVSASYLYDPIHRQGQKTVGSTKTRYIYNGEQRIADYDGTSGSLLDRYVFGVGLDEPLIKVSSGGTITYFHHDRVGSIVAISDNSGAVTNTFAYSPWGESASLSGTSFGFTGQRYDSETELYFFKSRHYSPAIGRFLQPDPIGYIGGLNLYAYVKNDPLGFVDPMGFKGSPIPGGVSDGGGGGPIGFGPLYSSSPFWAQFDQFIGLVLNTASFFHNDWISYLATVHSHQENILKAGEVIADRYGGKILDGGGVVLNAVGRRGSPAHVAEVLRVETLLKNLGWAHKAGGTKPERGIKIPGGNLRYPDLHFELPDGSDYFHQVGRSTKEGIPVKREIDAGLDLLKTARDVLLGYSTY